jgi:trehalose utilization protein
VLVWDEQQPAQKNAYGGKFFGETIAAHLARQPGLSVKTAALTSPEQGLDEATLDATDVIIWWGHIRNAETKDALAERVVSRVLKGNLSLIALHSAHWSKPFVRLMQERAKADALAKIAPDAKIEFTNDKPIGHLPEKALTPSLERIADGQWRLTLPQCVFPGYRADGAPGHMTTRMLDHPIAKGLPSKWDIPRTEMCNEPFHVPDPDAVVFEEHWDKGEHFRSGCVWNVGKGRVFYFRPGHETFPVFLQDEPRRVLENTVRWLPISATGRR